MCKKYLVFPFCAVLLVQPSARSRASVGSDEDLGKLREPWKAQVEKRVPDGSMAFYLVQVPILESFLTNSANSNLFEVAYRRLCNADIPSLSKNPENLDVSFDTVLLESMVDLAIQQKNTDELLGLIAHNCPRCVALCPLEFWLAAKWDGSIDILFDAFRRTRSHRTKLEIVRCLGHAFPSQRENTSDDDKFVQEAQAWYQKHRYLLRVNEDYRYLPNQSLLGNEPKGLFVFKDQASQK